MWVTEDDEKLLVLRGDENHIEAGHITKFLCTKAIPVWSIPGDMGDYGSGLFVGCKSIDSQATGNGKMADVGRLIVVIACRPARFLSRFL